MIPAPWEFLVIALAAFRATRLLGWDTFPILENARARFLREGIEPRCPRCNAGRDDYELGVDNVWRGLEFCPNCNIGGGPEFVPYYGRETLAELLACPFCLGAWVSLAAFLAWLAAPTVVLYAAVPLALSAAVGLIAKTLDA